MSKPHIRIVKGYDGLAEWICESPKNAPKVRYGRSNTPYGAWYYYSKAVRLDITSFWGEAPNKIGG